MLDSDDSKSEIEKMAMLQIEPCRIKKTMLFCGLCGGYMGHITYLDELSFISWQITNVICKKCTEKHNLSYVKPNTPLF